MIREDPRHLLLKIASAIEPVRQYPRNGYNTTSCETMHNLISPRHTIPNDRHQNSFAPYHQNRSTRFSQLKVRHLVFHNKWLITQIFSRQPTSSIMVSPITILFAIVFLASWGSSSFFTTQVDNAIFPKNSHHDACSHYKGTETHTRGRFFKSMSSSSLNFLHVCYGTGSIYACQQCADGKVLPFPFFIQTYVDTS